MPNQLISLSINEKRGVVCAKFWNLHGFFLFFFHFPNLLVISSLNCTKRKKKKSYSKRCVPRSNIAQQIDSTDIVCSLLFLPPQSITPFLFKQGAKTYGASFFHLFVQGDLAKKKIYPTLWYVTVLELQPLCVLGGV